jgi:hypothetical protein
MRISIPPQFRQGTGLGQFMDPMGFARASAAEGGFMENSMPMRPSFAALAAFFSALLLLAAHPLAAPAQQTAAPSAPAHKALHAHTRPGAAPPLTAPTAAAPAPAAVAAPEAPHWPANDSPVPASVVWDSQGLRIDAENSSLQQIMKDFSTATGAQVDGLAADERVFGSYGPGQARDVLSELLQGSGYNVIMIGDQGQGAPRQIVLSARQATGAQPASAAGPASSADDDAEADEPPQPPQIPPLPFRPGFPPGGLPRTPQQINIQEQQMREQQMRQQQLQQQQLQQQQQTQPPGSPPT